MIRFLKRLLIGLLLTLVVLSAAAGLMLWDGYRLLHAPLSITQPSKLELATGSRLRDAVLQMRSQGYFTAARQAIYLEAWARLTGEASLIKAGEYELEPGVSSLHVLSMLVDGRMLMHELRIVEGTSFDQALKLLRQHPDIKLTLQDTRPQAVMEALGHPELHPEGRFFPDTYRFPKGTTDVVILRKAFDAMDRALTEIWERRMEGRTTELPYARRDDALIMASIVEKETGLASERTRIAGVFVRRLQQGMKLQTDPTVIYGLGETFDGNLRKRDLLADGPYNTYARVGLPPTPICLPGRASLEAAVTPAEGTELFFVSRRDGSHQFSTTWAEHEAAVRQFQLGQGG
ncbi:MAG: endolytic transglycosylase MltG [Panacagrimonas sp.]